MTSTALQRLGPLAELGDALPAFGVPLAAVLAGTGLEPEDLKPETRLPFATALTLLERAATLTRCPHFGLSFGARFDQRALGPIGTLMSHAPTLGDALRDYVGMQLGYSHGATAYLQRMGDDFALGYGIYDRASPGSRQIYDLAVAVGCNMVRALTGGRARVERVQLSCRVPENVAPYLTLLRAPLAFDQEQTGIVISAADMAIPLPHADPVRRAQLRDQLFRQLQGTLDHLPARVRHALRPRLLLGEGNREAIAREMGLSSRTLSRRLAIAGTSFEAIKDEVRFAVARDLLALTDLPVGQIGGALAYTTHSAFNHAFRRWSGLTPSEWRIAQAAAPA